MKEQNVKFEYLYRDAGNFKNWGDVIFSNKRRLPIENINNEITLYLIDGLYFNANELEIKDLHSNSIDIDLDHDWHEFHACKNTDEYLSDVKNRDISDIILKLQKKKLVT